MITIKHINNLTLESIEEIEVFDLQNKLILQKLLELAQDPQVDSEPYVALNFYDHISSLIDVDKTNYENFDLLAALLNILGWKSFPLLNPKVKKELFIKQFLAGIRNNVDIKYFLFKDIRPFEFGLGPDKQRRRDYINFLDNNLEVLGSSELLIENKYVKPELKSWFTLYNSFLPIRKNRGSFEQLKFLQSNSDVRKLNVLDKQILNKALEIYDWLLFSVAEVNILKDENFVENEKQKITYSNTQKFTMPDELREGGQEKGEKSSLAQPLVKKVEDVSKSPIISSLKPPLVLPKNIQAGVVVKPTGKDLDVAIKPNAAPVKPVTAGLEDIRKEIEHKKALAQAEIEKKLEGLKKRGSSK